MASSGEKDEKIPKLSGTPETLYRDSWRAQAKACLFGLPEAVPAKKYGSKLKLLLSGEAARITKHVEIEAKEVEFELGKEGAEDIIFGILDARWPKRKDQDTVGDDMDELFELKFRKGEDVAVFVGRVRTCFETVERADVKLPQNVKGYLLTRFFGLRRLTKGALMVTKGRNWGFEKVAEALPDDYPGGPPAGGTEKQFLAADGRFSEFLAREEERAPAGAAEPRRGGVQGGRRGGRSGRNGGERDPGGRGGVRK